ncbi:carboxylate--amine ligase [Enterococcus sp. LJL128]
MKKILMSEGASLTSRETLTVLKKAGVIVDVMGASKWSISRFSKWRRHYFSGYRVNEPKAFLKEISTRHEQNHYTCLLPTHEEIWLFAWTKNYLKGLPVYTASKDAFEKVEGKRQFAQLSEQIHFPQPQWCLAENRASWSEFPCWLKADFSTAGRGVVKIHNPQELEEEMQVFAEKGIKVSDLMIQKNVSGTYGQVQALFEEGKLIAVHSSQQTGIGPGGSAAARISCDSTEAIQQLNAFGRHTGWNGGITFDFIKNKHQLLFIECNPRMVEPGNAAAAGVNFPELLIGLNEKQEFTDQPLRIGKAGVKTHSTLALLMGTAEKTESRLEILKIFFSCLFHKGMFKESREVLTPLNDLPSLLPLMVAFIIFLMNPKVHRKMTAQAVNNYSLSPEIIQKIAEGGCDKSV